MVAIAVRVLEVRQQGALARAWVALLITLFTAMSAALQPEFRRQAERRT